MTCNVLASRCTCPVVILSPRVWEGPISTMGQWLPWLLHYIRHYLNRWKIPLMVLKWAAILLESQVVRNWEQPLVAESNPQKEKEDISPTAARNWILPTTIRVWKRISSSIRNTAQLTLWFKMCATLNREPSQAVPGLLAHGNCETIMILFQATKLW